MDEQAPSDPVGLLRQHLPEQPIVILAKALEPGSTTLTLQDYVMNGETVIPLFSSKDAMAASTKGVDLGRPLAQISRSLLAQIARGPEVFLLDPQLPTQVRFIGDQLRLAFPAP